MKNSIKALLLSLLMAAAALTSAACSGSDESGTATTPENSVVTTAEANNTTADTKDDEQTEAPEETEAETNASEENEPAAEGLWANAKYTEDTEVGEGAVTVAVKVIAEEKTITVTVHTDKDNLGDALTENDLVAGDESEYGLYIKSVNGILADYDANQSWWAISKDGEMLMTGADSTPIADGENYELTYTKG